MTRGVSLLSLVALLALCAVPSALGQGGPATYWVSPSGTAAWQGCRSAGPLDGTAACSMVTANANAAAGDLVYLRGGEYPGQKIQPANSGFDEASRIVFSSYDGETPLIRDSDDGIRLYKRSYVTISGVSFYSMRRFLRIYAGHYNIVSYCSFDQRSPTSGEWAGGIIADDYNDNTSASESSTHNWVHHCTFKRFVYGTYAEHRGALLDIGSSAEGEEDESYYNLVEDCTFAYGGHHTLGVYSKYNVIRNNYFHNETNAANWAFEGYRATLTEGPHAGYCLYEGNRYGDAGASGLALRSQRNIFRHNLLYHCGSGAIQVVSNLAGVDHADNNRIYRNTFFHNGYIATDTDFQAGMYFASWSGQSPVGNVVSNNIFFDNRNGSIGYDGAVTPQIITNNWDQNTVNPGLVDLSGSDPDDPSLPDLRLTPGSAAIDVGSAPTSVASPSGSGTTLQLTDATYFLDGWGVPGVQGDLIQLLGTWQRARITAIDYATNTITVDRALTWAQGQGVALAYQGSAPDLGAFEMVAAGPSGFFPLPPCRVLDTRVTSGAQAAAPELGVGQRRLFNVAGTCGVPVDARAFSGNLTVVGATAAGDLRVTSGNLVSTVTSALSFPLARARANNAIVELATNGAGTIAVTNDSAGTTHVVLDVNGYFR